MTATMSTASMSTASMSTTLTAADKSIAAIKSTYKGIGGMFLPAHLVGYIASFCKATYDISILLNIYKAFESFECEGDEDPLFGYKDLIQHYIAALAIPDVYGENENDRSLTKREIMYVYDVAYCVTEDIIYGLEPKNSHRKWIDDEQADCVRFAHYFGVGGLRFGICTGIDTMIYKHTRLLEEALRTNSQGLLTYMRNEDWIYPAMLAYIYCKHNNARYAPAEDYLSNNPLWLDLLKEHGMLNMILGLAIGGIREHTVYSMPALHNIVQPNLAMVKQIVPAYIQASAPVAYLYPYSTHPHGAVNNYEYWQQCFLLEVKVYKLGYLKPVETFLAEGESEIGEYLKSCL
jgi:hypothetical protein